MSRVSTHCGQPEVNAGAGQALVHVLSQAGFAVQRAGNAVLLPSGLRLEAGLLEIQRLEDGRAATATRIVALHDALFADGLSDVQYAIGADAEQAMVDGFSVWAQSALVTLEEAVRGEVCECTLLALSFPALSLPALRFSAQGDDVPGMYQAVLEPIVFLGGPPGVNPAQTAEDEAPCPACMITRIQDALGDRLRVDGYTGISLFAGRDAAGALAADCRVNGEPFPEGAERLAAYAHAWPARGFELRQQYVVVRPAPPLRRREKGA